MKVGITLPIAGGPGKDAPRWAEIRELALWAEDAGFDSIWLYDHLLFRFEDQPTFGIWEAWTLLAALAEATERVELGVLVVCTAFRNPGVLAKMADALDEVSGGRLILGLGAGWHRPEFDAFGLPFDHLYGRFEESLAVIAPLLRTGQADFSGRFVAAANCVSLPRGPRENGPPILVAAFGPKMLRLTARHADAWNTAWHGAPDRFRDERDKMFAACAEEGRDPATLEVTVGVTVVYPDLEADLPPGSDDPTRALRGSPEEVAAGLRTYRDEGVGHVVVSPTPETREAMGRVAEAVRILRAG
jgi:alkanesulfonate monooxygenase SsuD/methylene tetrahydromethanopterin reductase-like flavin-dependent oxidoreductase (luciferase family)